jgi:hypothetical protein
MSIHFYRSTSLDMNKIAEGLLHNYSEQHFEVQHLVDQNHGFVQIKKGGVVRAVTGFGKAITIRMQQVDGGLRVRVAIEDWVEKLAAEGIAVLFVAIITGIPAIIGSIDEVHLAHTVMGEVDRLVLEQDAGVEIERHYAGSIQ